jgi:hypothetical protein
MENLTNLESAIEDLKSLIQPETKEGLVDKDLAKRLAESFDMAYKSLGITNNITE